MRKTVSPSPISTILTTENHIWYVPVGLHLLSSKMHWQCTTPKYDINYKNVLSSISLVENYKLDLHLYPRWVHYLFLMFHLQNKQTKTNRIIKQCLQWHFQGLHFPYCLSSSGLICWECGQLQGVHNEYLWPSIDRMLTVYWTACYGHKARFILLTFLSNSVGLNIWLHVVLCCHYSGSSTLASGLLYIITHYT